MAGAVLTDGSNKHVIKVDLAELGALAERMADHAQQIHDELDLIEQEVTDLGGSWSDANRKRFLTYFSNNHSAYTAQANYLSSYAESLAEVKRLYEGLLDEIDAVVSGAGA